MFHCTLFLLLWYVHILITLSGYATNKINQPIRCASYSGQTLARHVFLSLHMAARTQNQSHKFASSLFSLYTWFGPNFFSRICKLAFNLSE